MTGNPKSSKLKAGFGKIASARDSVKASFGFPSGIAMLIGIMLGLALPEVDDALGVDVPVLAFDSPSSARSLLETIGTTTVAVAGLSFSVTVVAFTLASSQLSPRVLRSFRSDRLSQITLALFLGAFVYSLALLVRLGVSGEGSDPPNLSMTVAVLLAFAAFGTFAAFIAHIISMLQPSSVISAIHSDAVAASANRYPSGPGEPEDREVAARSVQAREQRGSVREVHAESSGYLTVVDAGPLIEAAADRDGLVSQSVLVGTYVLPGQVVAEIRGEDVDEDLDQVVLNTFVLGDERTLVQDIAFPVRQLADIALKGLSPGVNDPTTTENAIDSMGSFLVEFTRSSEPSPVRTDDSGEPRLVAMAPGFDDLLRLGFEQVRVAAETHPVICRRMLELLQLLEFAVAREGIDSREIGRQRGLIEDSLSQGHG